MENFVKVALVVFHRSLSGLVLFLLFPQLMGGIVSLAANCSIKYVFVDLLSESEVQST